MKVIWEIVQKWDVTCDGWDNGAEGRGWDGKEKGEEGKVNDG